MFSYRVYGHTLNINIPLNLPSIPPEVPDYKILVQEGKFADKHIEWVHDYEVDKDTHWFRLGKYGLEYLISFNSYASFLVNEKKRFIHCFSSPHTQTNTIEHLLLDQVLPRLLSRRNFLVLHAGAVLNENGTIGFLGKTGCGKSTLTAFLGQNGHSILTDDCCVLQRKQDSFLVLPSYPAIRLNPDMAAVLYDGNDHYPHVAEYSNKRRLDPAQGNYVSHKFSEALMFLFILTEPDQEDGSDIVSIEQCSMRDAFSELIANTFRLDPTDRKSSVVEFENINTLVSSVPIFRLKYSRRKSVLISVANAMRSLCEQNSNTK